MTNRAPWLREPWTCNECGLVTTVNQKTRHPRTHDPEYIALRAERERARDRARRQISGPLRDRSRDRLAPGYHEKAAARVRRYRASEATRMADLARKAVARALARGLLHRAPCAVCAESRVEAHHFRGYALEQRLDVTWLCKRHHEDAHHRADVAA